MKLYESTLAKQVASDRKASARISIAGDFLIIGTIAGICAETYYLVQHPPGSEG